MTNRNVFLEASSARPSDTILTKHGITSVSVVTVISHVNIATTLLLTLNM